MIRSIRYFMLLAGLSGGMAGVSSAVVLVNDSFTDGGRTNGADPLDSAWFKNESGSTLGVTAVSDNNVLSYVPGGTFRAVSTQFTTTTLAVGDSISVSLSVRYPTAPGSQAGGLRIGLLNYSGTLADSATRNGTDSGYTATGYYANFSTGPASNTYIRKESGGTDGMLGGTDYSDLGTTNTSTNPGLTDTNIHTLSFTLTRTEAGLTLVGGVDGATTLISTTDSTSPYFSFNTFAISNGNNNIELQIDDVLIQYNTVPEPSAALLGVAGAVSLLGMRRRSSR